jgi:hypothetical protein
MDCGAFFPNTAPVGAWLLGEEFKPEEVPYDSDECLD